MGKLQEHMGGRIIVEQGQWHRYFLTIRELDIVKRHVPSVTQVIGLLDKPALPQWAANCACDLIKQKRDDHVESVLSSLPPDQRNRPVMIPAGVIEQWAEDARFNFRNVKKRAAEIGSLAHDYLEGHLKWVHFGQAKPERPVVDQAKGITEDQVDAANNSIDAGLDWFGEHKIKLISTETMLVSPLHGFAGREDWKMEIDGEYCNGDFKSGSGIYDEVWLQLAAYKQMNHELYTRPIEASWAIHINKKTGEFNAIRRSDEFFKDDIDGFLGLLRFMNYKRKLKGEPVAPSGITLPVADAKKLAK